MLSLFVNVNSNADLVPTVDKLGGAVLKTQCTQTNPWKCHMVGLVVCDLMRRCGDFYNTKFQACFTL